MLDSKVVESIRMLSGEERTEFEQFLMSPYFQKGFSVEEFCSFYTIILDALSSAPTVNFQKAAVHEMLFLDKAYSESRMDRIMFELNRLVQVFLLTKNYHRKENEVQRLLDWSEIQRKKNQPANIIKQFQRVQEQFETGKASLDTYFEQYLLAKEEYEWHSTFNRMKGDLGIPAVVKALDLFYYSQRLGLLNSFLLQQKGTTLDTPEEIAIALNAAPPPGNYLKNNALLLITQKIHELFRQDIPETGGFQELMHLLNEHEAALSPEILFQFYTYLRNYCTILIDAGNTDFESVLHDIQKDNLQRGYYYVEGKIQPYAVLNITMLALRVGKTDWAKTFLESHKDKIIDENESRDFYHMNLALCLFAEKKHDKALELIPFGSTYSYYHLMARRLELKIYYELNSELLPSKIDAFKMFISRAGNKSMSPHLSELFTNFGNFVHQLSLSIPGDKKRSEQLINRIQAKKLVGERGWLLEKAKALGEARKI